MSTFRLRRVCLELGTHGDRGALLRTTQPIVQWTIEVSRYAADPRKPRARRNLGSDLQSV